MKKIIPVLLFCCIQYFVSAQSDLQKSANVNVSRISTGSSGNSPTYNVSTSNSNSSSNSNSNYQQVRATPNSSPNYSNASYNQPVPNNQLYTTSGSKHFNTVTNKGVAENNIVIPAIKPVLIKKIFPYHRPSRKDAVKNSNVLFSTVADSSNVFTGKPITPVLINVARQNNGTSGVIKTAYIYPKIKHYRYRCIYGNYTDFNGLGWYSIHVASFKNPEYCKPLIRYLKNKYKLEVYVFDDLSSVNMRYHLVLGKYRAYFVASNILRYISKEMPYAFIVNWNRYAQMILFQ